MSELILYPEVGNGEIMSTSAAWATARNTGYEALYGQPESQAVRVKYDGSQYQIARPFFYFLRSGIPPYFVVESGSFLFHTGWDGITPSALALFEGTQGSSISLDTLEFNAFGATELAARIDPYVAETLNEFVLGPAAIAILNAGDLRLCIRDADNDVDNVAPSSGYEARFSTCWIGSEYADGRPRLVLQGTQGLPPSANAGPLMACGML